MPNSYQSGATSRLADLESKTAHAPQTSEMVRFDLNEPPLSATQPPEGYKVQVDESREVPCQP